jgi:hypothetical protein
VILTATPTIDRIGKALENLALAALNDTTILQQLTAANLALTALLSYGGQQEAHGPIGA